MTINPALIEKPIVFLAGGVNPFETAGNDGYDNRVVAIDAQMCHRNRIYFRFFDGEQRKDAIRQIGLRCFELEVSDFTIASDVIRRATGVYCHSIYAFGSSAARTLVSKRLSPLIVDMHGVVPEEVFSTLGADKGGDMETLETWVMLSADALVFVTHQMKNHFQCKYSWVRARQIICPIFNNVPGAGLRDRDEDRSDVVVYAGGTQAWQKVELVVELVEKCISQYQFVILSPNVDVFVDLLAEKGISPGRENLIIQSATRSEVQKFYAKSRYGILFRDDNVINRVSCPTKLIEYLNFGLLPIMTNANVGDFVNLGMNYAHIRDLERNCLPKGSERKRLIAENIEVSRLLQQTSQEGLASINRLYNS